ncbi:hypothetical protein BDE02_04G135800 [Populus trichocarpa]|jgi:hypothetical protein|nr:hypothetical protein BDE02_04G135800 [Populus trichocarpa]
MDSFNITNIKIEKANAIKKHRKIQKIASLFRLIEIGLVLALISRFSIQLPVAVRNSSEYFKDLTVTLVSPRFVFVLGNVIVITLFAKSGQFSCQDSNGKNSSTDLYEEFVEKSEKSQGTHHYEAECREKQVTYAEHKVTEDNSTSLESEKYHRSQSERLKRPNSNKPCRELRRSATEGCRKSIGSDEELEKRPCPEDKMSNEEFRCTIEAFIARQKRFRIDEENSYVLE